MSYEEEGNDATQIYTQGTGADWSVSVTDDDQRTMSSTDIAIELARGNLSLTDTFVWKEGMTDWLPLGQVPELAELLGNKAPAAAPQPQAYAPQPQAYQAPAAPAPAGDEGLAGTMMMDGPVAAQPYAYGAPAPAPAAAAPVAARRAASPSVDVFQARGDEGRGAAAPSDYPGRATGARHEESSLFNISDLNAAAAARRAPPKAAVPTIERGQLAPPARKKRTEEFKGIGSGDLGIGAALGGAPMGGLGAFAGPDVTAPVAPPPPPPPQPVAAMSLQPGAIAAATLVAPPKSKAPLFIGIGAVVLVGAAVGIFFAMRGGGAEVAANTAAPSTQGATASTEPTETATATTTGEKVAMNDGPDTTASSEEPGADPSATASAGTTASASTTASAKATVGPKPDKTAAAQTAAATTTAAPTAEPPPSGGGEFDVSAARAQLSAKAGGAQGCAQAGGPTGRGQASVTFATSGRASAVSISAPFSGTPVGGCLSALFRGCAVPPFSGSAMQVSKSFFIK